MLEFLLPALPLLLLVGSLVLGRYPGLDAAMRLAERGRPTTSKPLAAASRPRPIPPRVQAIRGGLLIAFGLAQRPPPLVP